MNEKKMSAHCKSLHMFENNFNITAYLLAKKKRTGAAAFVRQHFSASKIKTDRFYITDILKLSGGGGAARMTTTIRAYAITVARAVVQ